MAGTQHRTKIAIMKYIVYSFVLVVMLLCSCRKRKTELPMPSQTEMRDTVRTADDKQKPNNPEGTDTDKANASESKITAEMAYEGVNNYCHKEYDWSPAEENPSIMYVAMGDETESEYKVIFRSYTSSFVYFYVDKTSGTTRMVESVPSLNIENETGTINLFDYLEKKE